VTLTRSSRPMDAQTDWNPDDCGDGNRPTRVRSINVGTRRELVDRIRIVPCAIPYARYTQQLYHEQLPHHCLFHSLASVSAAAAALYDKAQSIRKYRSNAPNSWFSFDYVSDKFILSKVHNDAVKLLTVKQWRSWTERNHQYSTECE
jgi:hypothetical protein